MKTTLLLWVAILAISRVFPLFAQNEPLKKGNKSFNQTPIYLGTSAEVLATFKAKVSARATNAVGTNIRVNHRIPGQTPLVLIINGSKKEGNAEIFFGKVDHTKQGTFF